MIALLFKVLYTKSNKNKTSKDVQQSKAISRPVQ